MKYFETLVQPQALSKATSTREDFSKIPLEELKQAENFSDLVQNSHLHLWKPNDSIISEGVRWMIGVWTASRHDMELLDILNEAIEKSVILNVRIDVFNSQYLSSWEELTTYIPNLPQLVLPPYIGLWNDGTFVRSELGYSAKKWLLDTYHLPLI